MSVRTDLGPSVRGEKIESTREAFLDLGLQTMVSAVPFSRRILAFCPKSGTGGQNL